MTIMAHYSKFGGSGPSYVTSAIRKIKFYHNFLIMVRKEKIIVNIATRVSDMIIKL